MISTTFKPFLAGVATTALAGALLLGLSGFQGGTSIKIGIVDLQKATKDLPIMTNGLENIRRDEQARQALAEFVQTYPTITAEQASSIRALSLKTTPITEAERKQLDALKAAVIADEKKARDLQTKANPTQDDLKAIEAYRTRAVASREMLQNWLPELRNELLTKRNEADVDLNTRMRAIVAEVAKKGGYSVVYAAELTPYAANDITDEVKKAAEKLK